MIKSFSGDSSKSRKQVIGIAAAAVILAAAIVSSAQSAFAQNQEPVFEKTNTVRYAKKASWFYREPEDGAAKAGKIKKSRSVKVTGISEQGWSRVLIKKKTYYMKSARLAETNGYLVAIDAGHQRKGNPKKEPIGPGAKEKKAKVSSGATGVATGIPEYKLTLKMAKKLKSELESRGYKVKMIRSKHDVNISNSRRAKIANKAKADVFIRIHANSSASGSAKGALTIAPTKKNKYCKKVRAKSRTLSKAVLSEFCKATGAKNRGVMYTDSMSGINWSKVPVTIMEMGFLSNKKEDRKMNKSAKYQRKMVKGMANGIDRYFKRK